MNVTNRHTTWSHKLTAHEQVRARGIFRSLFDLHERRRALEAELARTTAQTLALEDELRMIDARAEARGGAR